MRFRAAKLENFKETWGVEAIEQPGDFVLCVALFTGDDAAVRAKAYADWHNLDENSEVAA